MGTAPDQIWPDDRTDALRQIYADAKQSFQAIANKLGMTRGAISGKIQRMIQDGDLEPRKQDKDPILIANAMASVKKRNKDAAQKKPAKIIPDILDLEPLLPPETWPDGYDTCRYIIGDPAEPGWAMCGRPGFPWCKQHMEKIFQPLEERQKVDKRVLRE